MRHSATAALPDDGKRCHSNGTESRDRGWLLPVTESLATALMSRHEVLKDQFSATQTGIDPQHVAKSNSGEEGHCAMRR